MAAMPINNGITTNNVVANIKDDNAKFNIPIAIIAINNGTTTNRVTKNRILVIINAAVTNIAINIIIGIIIKSNIAVVKRSKDATSVLTINTAAIIGINTITTANIVAVANNVINDATTNN
jgi:hypothetical protein